MTLWVILLTVLTSVATVLATAPFLRRLGGPAGAAPGNDVATCLDRLSDIERRAAAGLLGADEAAAARADVKQRILAATRAERTVAARLSAGERRLTLVAAAAIAIAMVFTAGLYMMYGMYGAAAPPSTSAEVERLQGAAAVEALAAATSQSAAQPLAMQQPASEQPGQPQQQLGSVDEMAARLAVRLKRNPNDPEGWRMLGWAYVNIERFAEAAAAYARALDLSPNRADLASAYGEALVRAGDGRVGEEAKSAFARALRLDAKEARARFFMGVVKEQAGDKAAALDEWIAVLNEADAKEPWYADLTQRVTALGRETGIDVSVRLRRAEATGGVLAQLEQPAAGPPKGGPTADDVRNANAMPPADRAAMIRSMVEGLAARLEQSPADVDGWIKLIRSRKVLGETHEAERALQRAMEVFKSAPQERKRIVAIGREMGLTP